MAVDKRKNPERTIAFWRLVHAPDGGWLDPIDWPTFLAKIDKRRREKKITRYDVDGTDMTGSVYTRDATDHLACAFHLECGDTGCRCTEVPV